MNKKGNQASPLSSSGRSKMQRIVYLVIVYAMSLGLIFTAFTSVITSTTYTVLRVPGFDSCSVAVRESSFLLQSKGDLYEELLPSVYHKSRNWEVNNGARVISRGEFTFDRDTYFTYLELGTAATTQVSPSIFALECE